MSLIKTKLACRLCGGAWGSSKGRMAIRRIRMELSAISEQRAANSFF